MQETRSWEHTAAGAEAPPQTSDLTEPLSLGFYILKTKITFLLFRVTEGIQCIPAHKGF